MSWSPAASLDGRWRCFITARQIRAFMKIGERWIAGSKRKRTKETMTPMLTNSAERRLIDSDRLAVDKQTVDGDATRTCPLRREEADRLASGIRGRNPA